MAEMRKCLVKDCAAPVAADSLACRDHRAVLPVRLRSELWSAFRSKNGCLLERLCDQARAIIGASGKGEV